ncbi:hypothetical protein C8A00DRAFT_11153 [Chaetomidium leptoderma]|uniref:CENP-V/GFA domain-containing protein n=1 Tax=Chaetomidium leptoderma TaxID=669021 RepID=A0AAN7A1K6_9PEZI|nr:hypothetical protein C8A00DRAFT_11153 [Chaetomidium leptoderma]
MSETEQPTKTYRGNCHCGAFVFEIDAPEIKSVGDCKCSICSKRGYLWLVPQNPPTIVKDEGKLVSYAFASKNMDHQFCGNCGTTVMAASDMFPQKVGVNVRSIQGLDIWSLEVQTFDGDKIGPEYVAPTFSGPEPNPPGFEDGKIYNGSCHCGAVTTAVKVNGSLEDVTYKEPIMECNCSHCQRGGQVWIYPSKNQLAIQGGENLSYYTFGNHVWRKSFCKTCGVHIGAGANPSLTDDDVAALPEGVRNFRAMMINKCPTNLRALNGFDVKCVKPTRSDGWTRQQPQYVNP